MASGELHRQLAELHQPGQPHTERLSDTIPEKLTSIYISTIIEQ
jgi:hypothetical protein